MPPINVTFTGAPFYFLCTPGTGASEPEKTSTDPETRHVQIK